MKTASYLGQTVLVNQAGEHRPGLVILLAVAPDGQTVDVLIPDTVSSYILRGLNYAPVALAASEGNCVPANPWERGEYELEQTADQVTASTAATLKEPQGGVLFKDEQPPSFIPKQALPPELVTHPPHLHNQTHTT